MPRGQTLTAALVVLWLMAEAASASGTPALKSETYFSARPERTGALAGDRRTLLDTYLAFIRSRGRTAGGFDQFSFYRVKQQLLPLELFVATGTMAGGHIFLPSRILARQRERILLLQVVGGALPGGTTMEGLHGCESRSKGVKCWSLTPVLLGAVAEARAAQRVDSNYVRKLVALLAMLVSAGRAAGVVETATELRDKRLVRLLAGRAEPREARWVARPQQPRPFVVQLSASGIVARGTVEVTQDGPSWLREAELRWGAQRFKLTLRDIAHSVFIID